MQLNPRNDSPEKVLSSKTQNDGGNAGAGEESFKLGFSVIAVAEDEKKSDEKNQEGEDLAQNVRDGCLPFPLEVEVPEKMIGERDNESRAE